MSVQERNDLVIQLLTIMLATMYNIGNTRNSVASDKDLDQSLAITLVAINMFTLLPMVPYIARLLFGCFEFLLGGCNANVRSSMLPQ